MKKLLPILLSATLLTSTLSLSSCAVFTSQAKNNANVSQSNQSSFNYEHFVLDNGLNVYLTKNPEKPRFRAEIVVNAGGKQDPSDATGIAHYLEHMLFKGSENLGSVNFVAEKTLLDQITDLYDKRFKETNEEKRREFEKEINKLSIQASKYAVPNELASIYANLGAQGLNAYTSEEETVYIVDLPKNRLEQWAKIESDRFLNPVFRLFQSELETVYEEKNRSLDNKGRILYQAVQEALYKKHPYGTQTILGSVDHLKNPSLVKMYEFYKKYYVPNNMAIVISGDIDIPETKEIIKKYFKVWQEKKEPEFNPPVEEPLNGKEVVKVNYKGEEELLLSFRTVPYNHPDRYALTLVDMLLDGGSAGLIPLNLVNTQKLRGAGSYPTFYRDYGAQNFYGVLKENQTHEEVEKMILDEVEKIKQGKFDESLLEGIILNFEIGEKAKLESNSGRVNIMKSSFLNNTSIEELMSFTDKLKKVTKKEIVDAANKYFGDNYVAGYRYNKEYDFPKITKPDIEKVSLNQNQKSEFAQEVEALNVKPIQPKWVDYENDFKVKSYAPGVLYYYVENPLNDIFSFAISYDYGDKHYKNMCYVMDELDFAGVDGMTPSDVKNEFYKMGVNVNYSCSDYGFSLSMSGLDSQLEKALALSEKILWNAELDQNHFQEKVKNIINSRKDEKDNHNSLRGALSSYVAYGNESGYLDRPTNDELKTLSVSEYPLIKNELKKRNFEIYYSGQLPMDEVENIVKKYHIPQQINVPLLNPREKPSLELVKRHNKPVKIYFLDYKGAQAHINLIIPGKVVNPEKTLVNKLYNEYLDGDMSAILFQEVREARALAYSTWGYYYLGSRLGDQNQMRGYIGTQADKTVEALKLFVDLIKDTPISDKHFERATRSLENSYRTGYIDFRGVVGAVLGWAELGYDKDPRAEQFEKLNKSTMDDIKNYMKENISSESLTFTIVGDKSKINMNELAKIGEIEEVKINTLFTD